jgi:hypothetical protein
VNILESSIFPRERFPIDGRIRRTEIHGGIVAALFAHIAQSEQPQYPARPEWDIRKNLQIRHISQSLPCNKTMDSTGGALFVRSR